MIGTRSRTRLRSLALWVTVADPGAEVHRVVRERLQHVPRGRSTRVLARERACPSQLAELVAYPAFGAAQLIERRPDSRASGPR